MSSILLNKISKGKTVFGTWITMAYPEIVEALSLLPFDWFVFDMEHAPLDVRDVEFLLMAIKRNDIVPIVRVPWNDFVIVKRVLDIGSKGVLFPQISSKEEVELAIRSIRYPPKGIRGVGSRRCIMYGLEDVKEYFRKANDDIIVIVQIETLSAINNLEQIVSLEGIHGVFVGPYDLSAQLGIFGEFSNPKYIETIKRIAETAKRYNKMAGIHTFSAEDALEKIDMGFNFIAISSDIGFTIGGAKMFLKELNIL